MVKENLIIVSLSDISKVRILCKKCQEEAIVRIDSQTSLPMECPYCNGMWLKPVRQNPVAKVPEIEFINQIRMMIKNQHAPVELRFEFKDEEVARSSPS